MSATLTSIQKEFDTFFGIPETFVDFEIHDNVNSRHISFERKEYKCHTPIINNKNKSFVSFEQSLDRYFMWGNSIVEYVIKINNEKIFHYKIDPLDLLLPICIQNTEPEDRIILESSILFRKTAIKPFLSRLNKDMIRFVRLEASEVLE